MHRRGENRELLVGGLTVRICPAICGCDTRMTAEAWERLCKATQKRERGSMSTMTRQHKIGNELFNRYCGKMCQGEELPRGLELVEVMHV